MYTHVLDKELTPAGLRGGLPAQSIERLGATNQTADKLRNLIRIGRMPG